MNRKVLVVGIGLIVTVVLCFVIAPILSHAMATITDSVTDEHGLAPNFTLKGWARDLAEPVSRASSTRQLLGDLAYPSTFVIDTTSTVRYAQISQAHDARALASDVLTALAAMGH